MSNVAVSAANFPTIESGYTRYKYYDKHLFDMVYYQILK